MLQLRALQDGSETSVNLNGWQRQQRDQRDDAYRLQVPRGVLSLPNVVDNRKYCSPIEDQGALGSCTAQMLAGLIEANEVRAGRKLAQGTAESLLQDDGASPVRSASSPEVQVTNVTMAPNGSISFTATVLPAAQVPKPTPDATPAGFVHLSRLFSYYATRLLQGTTDRDSGATIRNTIKAAANYGVVNELLYPYVPAQFTANPPQSIWDLASKYRVTSYHAIADGDLTSMKSSLSSGYLVGFGFDVYSAFLSSSVAKSGLLCRPAKSETLQGGHAVCLVGYDDAKVMPDKSRGAFLVRNSWGSKWGQSGYFWMSYNYVADTNLCSDFWIVQSSPI